MSQQERITKVVNEWKQPIHVTLQRGARGNYRWAIDVRASDMSDVLFLVSKIDGELRRRFKSPTEAGLKGGEIGE